MQGLRKFDAFQSIKNTVHTFLIPAIHYHFLVFFGVSILIFILYLKKGVTPFSKKNAIVGLFTMVIVSFSFFLHCYTLSDIVPGRGALWAYCLMLFMLSTLLFKDSSVFEVRKN
jgi:hypothetical protein